jgi:DNA polymerase-3 subunit epsilon
MYAVIDTETTGLSRYEDRVLEVAIIGLDAAGAVEWEWCTLLNPGSPTHGMATSIHGIYDGDLVNAPSFTEVGGYISFLLNGRVLIGHNVTYDVGMLDGEFARAGYASAPVKATLCTMGTCRELGLRPYTLEASCAQMGVEFAGAHHALADARGAAGLARQVFDLANPATAREVWKQTVAHTAWPQNPILRHDGLARPVPATTARTMTATTAFVTSSVTVSVNEPSDREKYLTLLDVVMEDRIITDREAGELDEFAGRAGIDAAERQRLNLAYVQELAGGMWADKELSVGELGDLRSVADLLSVSTEHLEWAIENPTSAGVGRGAHLQAGDRIAFTGATEIDRSVWTQRAQAAGVKVTGSVSGLTDWLIVPANNPMTAKGRAATEKGTRIVTEQTFARMMNELEAGSHSPDHLPSQ